MPSRADVYFNLHRKLFSVRVGGRVVDHVPFVVLQDCTFAVQPAGRERVRTSGVKNVHAFVRGERMDQAVVYRLGRPWRVRYNPFEFDSFVTINDHDEVHPIFGADYVLLEVVNERPQMRAWNPRREK